MVGNSGVPARDFRAFSDSNIYLIKRSIDPEHPKTGLLVFIP